MKKCAFASLRSLSAATAICAVSGMALSAQAEMEFDWSAEVGLQLGSVSNELTLEKLSTVPAPVDESSYVVGRFDGRFDFTLANRMGDTLAGLDVGLYSNPNTKFDESDGITEFDRTNLELTRIRENDVVDFDKLMLFYDNPDFGRFELGWSAGPNHRLLVTPATDWGVGSFAGDYPYFFDKPQDIGFVGISAYGSANTSPRLSYYTPEFFGTVIGVSYQADTRNSGFDFEFGDDAPGLMGRRILDPDASLDAADDVYEEGDSYEGHTAGFTNVFEASIRNEAELGPVTLITGFGFNQGTAVDSPSGYEFNDLSSFQAGMSLLWGPLTLGFGGVAADDSGYAELAHWRQRQDRHSVYIGGQYEWDDWTFGLARFYSDDAGDPTERSDRQQEFYSAGLRYEYSETIDIGVEYDFIQPLSADYGDYDSHTLLMEVRWKIDSE